MKEVTLSVISVETETHYSFIYTLQLLQNDTILSLYIVTDLCTYMCISLKVSKLNFQHLGYFRRSVLSVLLQ